LEDEEGDKKRKGRSVYMDGVAAGLKEARLSELMKNIPRGTAAGSKGELSRSCVAEGRKEGRRG
jgi:hypothetical protein